MRRPLVHRFTEKWRTDEGNVVLGSIQDAPDVSQEADFNPRRIMVVRKSPLVRPGTVLSGQGTAYLMVDQVTLGDLMRFRAYEITHRLRWMRHGVVTDPVTMMPTNGDLQLLHEALPVVLEPLRILEEKGIERPKYRVFSGAPILLGDKLGSFQVHTSIEVLGVHQFEVI